MAKQEPTNTRGLFLGKHAQAKLQSLIDTVNQRQEITLNQNSGQDITVLIQILSPISGSDGKYNGMVLGGTPVFSTEDDFDDSDASEFIQSYNCYLFNAQDDAHNLPNLQIVIGRLYGYAEDLTPVFYTYGPDETNGEYQYMLRTMVSQWQRGWDAARAMPPLPS